MCDLHRILNVYKMVANKYYLHLIFDSFVVRHAGILSQIFASAVFQSVSKTCAVASGSV